MNKTSKKKWQKKAVRDYVREKYPITFRHVWDAKETDHLPFAREMMNYEADLFIDGILKEIEQKDLAALSVHDCIYCKRTDEETIEEIMQKHILEKIPSGKFKLDKELVKYKEREGVLCL